MRKKLFYEAPDAEVLVIHYEDAFLEGTNTTLPPSSNPSGPDEYDNQGEF